MNYVQVVGFIAAGLVIATLSMRTMVPLRIVGLCSNVAFVSYGILFHSYPTIVLHSILFPLNIYRLREMLNLIKQVENASRGDLSMDWIKPFMHQRAINAGEILFRKGDEADSLFYVISGRLHLQEIDVDGMLAPARTRTQTLACTESGTMLEISYHKIEELYYQNPKFGFYFLRLSTGRLFENIAKLEQKLAERDREIRELRGAVA